VAHEFSRGGKHLSWAAVVAFVILIAAAATGSALTAPKPRWSEAPTPTPALTRTAPTTTGCASSPGSPSLTLSDTSPMPKLTVTVGSPLVVMVPSWTGAEATDLRIVDASVLSEICTVLLSDHGREAVLFGVRQGQSLITATVTPASNAMMPAWLGLVTVVN
jgi:hypothetical protein